MAMVLAALVRGCHLLLAIFMLFWAWSYVNIILFAPSYYPPFPREWEYQYTRGPDAIPPSSSGQLSLAPEGNCEAEENPLTPATCSGDSLGGAAVGTSAQAVGFLAPVHNIWDASKKALVVRWYQEEATPVCQTGPFVGVYFDANGDDYISMFLQVINLVQFVVETISWFVYLGRCPAHFVVVLFMLISLLVMIGLCIGGCVAFSRWRKKRNRRARRIENNANRNRAVEESPTLLVNPPPKVSLQQRK
eukprot:TRINITY_DN85893_c0_g1_i1.p1 TRINITY_DN85893_c0_g1~~TRINITY_DN85893_c0_g1_i1.p1  ORF type:complete len:248 (+),score=7.86 TRINITY_DN85893_c0_g1_i1:35-778(+)